MLHKAWNSKGEMPYRFPRSSVKFQGHMVQNITDFYPNWAFPDYRPVAAFKSLRFVLFLLMGLRDIRLRNSTLIAWAIMLYDGFENYIFNTLRPRQNGRHFADDMFKCIFLNENIWILIEISLKFVPQGPINNIPALV